jgi:hypothetical protein
MNWFYVLMNLWKAHTTPSTGFLVS